MRGHKISFYAKIRKIIPMLCLLPFLSVPLEIQLSLWDHLWNHKNWLPEIEKVASFYMFTGTVFPIKGRKTSMQMIPNYPNVLKYWDT